MEVRIPSRDYAIRCGNCFYMGSRFSNTPLHNLRLEYWTFGYVLSESYIRHPAVLTTSEIQRRLGIARGSARLLKQRIQLLASELKQPINHLIKEELAARFKGFNFPRDREANLRKYKKVPAADTLVLYSASQRANKGRRRYRHAGQTASIYKSDKLGGQQIGTLTHITSWKQGPISIESISDLRMETVLPILDGLIPKHTPLFTDEGYKFYYRLNRNHRMVNHSAKSTDKRYRWARNRWSKHGVNNQVAEGNGRALKQAFSQYGWINPKYSQLYLNEYSFFRNLKYFGVETIAAVFAAFRKGEATMKVVPRGPGLSHDSVSHVRITDKYENRENPERQIKSREILEGVNLCADTKQQICAPSPNTKRTPWIKQQLKKYEYAALSLDERNRTAYTSGRNALLNISSDPRWNELRNEMERHSKFHSAPAAKHRKARERFYSALAERVWQGALKRGAFHGLVSLDQIAEAEKLPLRSLYRVVRRWEELGVITMTDVKDPIYRGHHFHIGLNMEIQPVILFVGETNEKTKGTKTNSRSR